MAAVASRRARKTPPRYRPGSSPRCAELPLPDSSDDVAGHHTELRTPASPAVVGVREFEMAVVGADVAVLLVEESSVAGRYVRVADHRGGVAGPADGGVDPDPGVVLGQQAGVHLRVVELPPAQ